MATAACVHGLAMLRTCRVCMQRWSPPLAAPADITYTQLGETVFVKTATPDFAVGSLPGTLAEDSLPGQVKLLTVDVLHALALTQASGNVRVAWSPTEPVLPLAAAGMCRDFEHVGAWQGRQMTAKGDTRQIGRYVRDWSSAGAQRWRAVLWAESSSM
eukprot:PLAT12264.4.p1 GENE.PLAT12264.4~~PLAT12264.4.p1  ORF type:complete len:158 (-),score=23.73 PLAT12264.4:22-495(-)